MSSPWSLTICCLGAGYVGGSTMAVIAAKCPTVRVLVADTNAAKIAQWNSADLPIFEPQLPDLVAATRDQNLFFKSDIDACIRDADIVFICVDTPTKQSGLGAGSASDTSKCEDCARRIAQVATTSKIIVEKSTVPVRTADALKQVLGANSTGKIPFEVVSNPEFLAEGSAVDNLLHPSRVLIGGDATPSGRAAVDKLVWLYSHWIPRETILTSSVWSSELAKLVANACLAQRLSSINSISAICEATGANVHEVAKAVGADDRIGANFLDASLGFGGSSFQKDVLNLVYLAHTLNLPEVAVYWKRVVHINDFQKRRFVKKILESMFNTVATKRICLFGLAYKQNTRDTRETVAASVIQALLTEQAVLAVYDPYVNADEIVAELERQGVAGGHAVKAGRLVVLNDAYEAASMAHAVVVITEFDGLKQLDFDRIYDDMAKPAFFFDGRNALPHRHLVARGAQVHAIGQGVFR